ncbi:site-specific DNA-methyltransferase [Megamonas funiformis]|uniref:site-specific DNA-methyltransferase n=1 Tax=Megamonas funiformis TaxID=437897 RepID=UPI003AF5F3F1
MGGGTTERYEFTWVGKNASRVEANTTTNKTLRPCIEESKDWDNTENLYIEGDNLEVLKLLQNSYFNKVKMIYIDPPYNTGNDFIYVDDFAQNIDEYEEAKGSFDEEGNRLFKNTDTNGRFHSDWCSMIYPRLVLARNLLADDGVIFISIDEKEFSNLKLIADEIFGNNNYRNQLLVRRRIKSLNFQFAENGLKSFNVGFEYILVYAKSDKSIFRALRMKKENLSDKGSWNVFWSNADRPSMRYEILGFKPDKGQWRWKKELADKAVKNYKIFEENFSDKMTLEEYWAKNDKNLRFVRRIADGKGKNGGVQYWVAPNDTSLRTSNWTDIEVSQIAKDFESLFNNPKNKDLIKTIIETIYDKNAIILDFFSGSATTAHAVMQLNAEDGGKRKFIMVQLPEKTDEKSEAFKAGYKNICEIGKERIRRAGEKIKEEAGLNGQDLDIGFRVLKLDSSNMKDIYYSADEYDQGMLENMQSNTKEDRTDLDLLFGCLVDWGLELDKPYTIKKINGHKVHIYNEGDLVACFEKDLDMKTIDEIAKLQALRVVFSDNSFVDSATKINVAEHFKMIAPDTDIKII